MKWRVCSLDVWGNPDDGFDVNQEFTAGHVEIDDGGDTWTDDRIRQVMIEEGYLTEKATPEKVRVDTWSSEGFYALEDAETGEPLYFLYADNAGE